MTEAIGTRDVASALRAKRSKRERPKLTIMAWIGLVIVVGSTLMAVLGPFVAPASPSAITLTMGAMALGMAWRRMMRLFGTPLRIAISTYGERKTSRIVARVMRTM